MARTGNEIWLDMLSVIKPQINEQSFSTWFDPLKPLEMKNNTLILQIPNKFFSEWIDEHYLDIIHNALEEIVDGNAKIEYLIPEENDNGNGLRDEDGNGKTVLEVKDESILPRPDRNVNKGLLQLNHQYSFETFVEGPGNQFARAVAYAVAEKPGKTNFNPLLIWGGVGLGKTHLAQAIGIFALNQKRAKELSYISSKRFMVDFINSVRNNKREEFTKQFDNVDLLIVDDIEYLIGKNETLVEFFHIFNILHQSGKQIVLTSDRPPRDFSGVIHERLTSRFQNGLVVDIKPPDLETRVAILQKKANDAGIDLTADVALLISTHITRNIRELQGALNHLLAYSSIMKTPIDAILTKKVLKELKYYESKPLSIEDIQKVVAGHYGIHENLLREKTRKKEIVLPRQIAMFLVKELTNHSLKTIGLHFGGRDHSTVLHALNSVAGMAEQNEVIQETIDALKQKVTYLNE
ncbi:chromosomal replication initiator protein DnaA [candidate division KSB1 bacterium]